MKSVKEFADVVKGAPFPAGGDAPFNPSPLFGLFLFGHRREGALTSANSAPLDMDASQAP